MRSDNGYQLLVRTKTEVYRTYLVDVGTNLSYVGKGWVRVGDDEILDEVVVDCEGVGR